MEVSSPQGTENRGAVQNRNAPSPDESMQPSLPSPFESRVVVEFISEASSIQQDCNQSSEMRPQQLHSAYAPGVGTTPDALYGAKGLPIPSPYPPASFPPSSCVPMPNVYPYPMVPAFDPRMVSPFSMQPPVYYPYAQNGGVVPNAAMYPSSSSLQQPLLRLPLQYSIVPPSVVYPVSGGVMNSMVGMNGCISGSVPNSVPGVVNGVVNGSMIGNVNGGVIGNVNGGMIGAMNPTMNSTMNPTMNSTMNNPINPSYSFPNPYKRFAPSAKSEQTSFSEKRLCIAETPLSPSDLSSLSFGHAMCPLCHKRNPLRSQPPPPSLRCYHCNAVFPVVRRFLHGYSGPGDNDPSLELPCLRGLTDERHRRLQLSRYLEAVLVGRRCAYSACVRDLQRLVGAMVAKVDRTVSREQKRVTEEVSQLTESLLVRVEQYLAGSFSLLLSCRSSPLSLSATGLPAATLHPVRPMRPLVPHQLRRRRQSQARLHRLLRLSLVRRPRRHRGNGRGGRTTLRVSALQARLPATVQSLAASPRETQHEMEHARAATHGFRRLSRPGEAQDLHTTHSDRPAAEARLRRVLRCCGKRQVPHGQVAVPLPPAKATHETLAMVGRKGSAHLGRQEEAVLCRVHSVHSTEKRVLRAAEQRHVQLSIESV